MTIRIILSCMLFVAVANADEGDDKPGSSGTVTVEPIDGDPVSSGSTGDAGKSGNAGDSDTGKPGSDPKPDPGAEPSVDQSGESPQGPPLVKAARELTAEEKAEAEAKKKKELDKKKRIEFSRGTQGELVGRSVKKIVVYGNAKTTKETVIALSEIEIGDRFDYELTQKAVKNLILSGLFKEADAFGGPEGEDGVRFVIKVRDKHSWIIAPTYYDQPTNRGGGVGFGENNLFGSNKKLLLYGQLATGDSFFIGAFVDPSIAQSRFRWQADVYLRDSRIFEFASATEWFDDPKKVRVSRMRYLNAGAKLGVQLGMVGIDWRLRGAKVEFRNAEVVEGATPEDIFGSMSSDPIPEPQTEGWDVSTGLTINVSSLEDWFGVRNGLRVKAGLERSLTFLGSDYDYWRASADFLLAKDLFRKKNNIFAKHNVVFKGGASYGRNLPFQQELTAGGTTQRGFLNDQFRGNLKVGGSVEYSLQLFELWGFGIRTLAFYDTSYVAFTDDAPGRHYLPGHRTHGLAPFKNSVGIGTRLFVKQIVLPLLGVDVGYGIERGSFEVYLAIGLTDV